MKILATLLISIVTILNVVAQNKTITVTVVNANNNEGNIKFALHNKETFLVKKPIQAKEAIIKEGRSTITFTNVPEGEYAVTCFHDKNSNGRMDFEANGMPMEDYGASNNVMNFGPPQYHNAKFTIIDKDVSLEIRL